MRLKIKCLIIYSLHPKLKFVLVNYYVHTILIYAFYIYVTRFILVHLNIDIKTRVKTTTILERME
jgi:hypothetical protein